jgi:hypothetical protein
LALFSAVVNPSLTSFSAKSPVISKVKIPPFEPVFEERLFKVTLIRRGEFLYAISALLTASLLPDPEILIPVKVKPTLRLFIPCGLSAIRSSKIFE